MGFGSGLTHKFSSFPDTANFEFRSGLANQLAIFHVRSISGSGQKNHVQSPNFPSRFSRSGIFRLEKFLSGLMTIAKLSHAFDVPPSP